MHRPANGIIDRSQIGTVPEGTAGKGGNVRGQLQRRDAGAVLEGISANGSQTVGVVQIFQSRTVCKGRSSDRFQLIVKTHIFQRGTAVERAVTDGRHGVGQQDTFQCGVALKSVACNTLNGICTDGFGDHHVHSVSGITGNADVASVQNRIRKICFSIICRIDKQCHGHSFHGSQHNTAGLGRKSVVGILKEISGIMITHHVRVPDNRQGSGPGTVGGSGTQIKDFAFGHVKDLHGHTGETGARFIHNLAADGGVIHGQQIHRFLRRFF